jgi:pantetheine-phosphate adenylyltransferase
MNVCLGGTFDPFHKGHEALLKKAFEVAGVQGHVFIGLASDKFAERKGEVRPYQERKHTLEKYLKKAGWTGRSTIQPLTDNYGPSIEGDFDAIIVSQETKSTAEKINKKRRQSLKKPLQIIVIPFVLAEDGQPIHSSRIRRKEIDTQGMVVRKE